MKAFADDPAQALSGQSQMKPEQVKIARLKREVIKFKAQRDILKEAAVNSTDKRNMIKFMSFLAGSQWRKWVGLAWRLPMYGELLSTVSCSKQIWSERAKTA